MRVLVGGVGYRNLRDHSFGVLLVDALAGRRWAADVSVEDISYNPIALVQRLQDDPPARRFDAVVVIAAVDRGGEPGELRVYRWDNELPSPELIQSAVAEAVTGVIALDNTLIIARYWKALPADVVVVEVEPEAEEFGDALSTTVGLVFGRACEVVTRMIEDPRSMSRLPPAPLGGRRFRHVSAGTADGRLRIS